MRTELEQERRMATNDRFGDAAGRPPGGWRI